MPRKRDNYCTELGPGEADERIDLTALSSYAGYQAGRRIALSCGCSLSPEAMSLIARVQFDKQSHTVHLDPTNWIAGWIHGFADHQLPTIRVFELISRGEQS